MLNLSLFEADPAGFAVTDGSGTWGTEVKMVPAAPNDTFVDRPATPVLTFWQIGAEGGFLPAPFRLGDC